MSADVTGSFLEISLLLLLVPLLMLLTLACTLPATHYYDMSDVSQLSGWYFSTAVSSMAAPSTTAAATAAVMAAVAAARMTSPAVVQQLEAGSMKPNGARRISNGTWIVGSRAASVGGKFSKVFRTAVEAACAADLTRLVLHLPSVTFKHLFRPKCTSSSS